MFQNRDKFSITENCIQAKIKTPANCIEFARPILSNARA
jgi:hypothetical protein